MAQSDIVQDGHYLTWSYFEFFRDLGDASHVCFLYLSLHNKSLIWVSVWTALLVLNALCNRPFWLADETHWAFGHKYALRPWPVQAQRAFSDRESRIRLSWGNLPRHEIQVRCGQVRFGIWLGTVEHHLTLVPAQRRLAPRCGCQWSNRSIERPVGHSGLLYRWQVRADSREPRRRRASPFLRAHFASR